MRHPFDAGDRVEVSGVSKPLYVRKMQLHYTLFSAWDGGCGQRDDGKVRGKGDAELVSLLAFTLSLSLRHHSEHPQPRAVRERNLQRAALEHDVGCAVPPH